MMWWSILFEEARWPFKIAFVAALLLLFAVISGCATPLTEEQLEERAYRHNEALTKWETCERVYNQMNVPTIHKDHQHRRGYKTRSWDVKDDLWRNNCHRMLCQAKLWECGEY